MIPLLLAATLSLQNPAAPGPEWKDLDGIGLIVNETIITEIGFGNRLAREKKDNPGTDVAVLRDKLKQEIQLATIGTQAGETMGLDASLVDRNVRDYERRLIESKGGLDDYTRWLAQGGQSAEEMREEIRHYVYRKIWEDSRTGLGPNQQSKVWCDRYVRPGRLRLEYDLLASDPRRVDQIGGSAAQLVLQILELDPVKAGGGPKLAEKAAEVRALAAQGTDFRTLAEAWAMPGTRSEPRDPFSEGELARIDPVLARLVATAKEGELLPPVPPRDKNGTWRVVRVVRRVPGSVPGFDSGAIQKKLRKLLEQSQDELRLERARLHQLEGSYIWPPLAQNRG